MLQTTQSPTSTLPPSRPPHQPHHPHPKDPHSQPPRRRPVRIRLQNHRRRRRNPLHASGRKYTNRACREFRDASGLPLFELHRKISLRNAWSVTLPGSDAADIATGAPRLGLGGAGFGNFIASFVNVAAVDVKLNEERRVTLEIERHGRVLESFDVVDGDRRVAKVRESIQHNKKLALMSNSRRGYRPFLDVTVMEGVDLSLVALVTIIAADSVFGSE
ncbi:hypothetical protein BDV30DRAFT_212858 [Aspergillus minisclerotigenes]|uniref:Tubby C-terminal-like domain-containing protein n=1 Tax=Aspergillus minisclerotigenes TaxID=656917 RepID=A0A5N6J0J3_9EURO|nr:hypothetical protein BDV30DRAFT_212858 [Aspergillus minisclerotigenes]